MRKDRTVMIIDAGGRGAVLVEAYSKSKQVNKILAVPGNDLMQLCSTKQVVTYPHLKTTSIEEIIKICKENNVSLVDVCQDNAVAVGLVDALFENGILAVGPTKLAGQIEWDKAWARSFGKKYKISQPTFFICHSIKEAKKYIQSLPEQRLFIKASGLAEGKGALPARNKEEALMRILEMEKFGDAGKTFLVEQWLQNDDGSMGEEFSLFVMCDGYSYQIVGVAQDHKTVNDFDEGENTGGMGASTPPLCINASLLKEIEKEIVRKTVNGLQSEERPYRGVLYVGGILIKEKGRLHPYVVEFNARWGDPEAQIIIPGLHSDMFSLSMAIAKGRLGTFTVRKDNKARVVIAGASRGYPLDYLFVKGKEIYGLHTIKKLRGVKLYGAGIKKEKGKYVANGGRLFYVVGEGENVLEARMKAYAAISKLSVEGNNLHYRTDIGWRDVLRLQHKK